MSRHLHKPIIFSLILTGFAACSGQKGPDTPAQAATQTPNTSTGARAGGAGGGRRGGGGPVPVVTAKAQSKSVPVTIPAVGTAEALSTVQVRAQVTGQL